MHLHWPRWLTLPGEGAELTRFLILLFFLFLCAIGGGGSRSDVLSLIYLRPAAVICIAALLLVPGPLNFGGLRPLLIMLGAFAALMLAQLIPLPPDLWLSLPGRAHYAEAAAAAGVAQPWRPFSLTPDLTWNSLLALLPALAVLIGFAGINEEQRRSLLLLVVGLAFASALLGIIQLTSAIHGRAFLYEVTHEGSAVGLFANRNHEAVLLALCLPLLRLWTLMPLADPDRRRLRSWTASILGLFFIAMILVTGSRAGIAVALIALVLTFLLAPRRRRERGPAGVLGWARRIAFWVVPIALVLTVIFFGRALSVQRLALLEDLTTEQRIVNLPVVIQIAKDFLPWGSGFGSFDAVFRTYEPDSSLAITYLNHAHNDPLELVLTGGLPALALALLFLGWWARAAWRAFRPYRGRSQATMVARGGAVAIALLLLGSIADYPLRTPLLSVVFMIACGWLARPPRPAEGAIAEGTEP